MAHADTDEAAGASRGGSSSTDRVAPHPRPSRGAGGPRQRAAGRVLRGDGGPVLADGRRPALLFEPDPLLRPVAENAVRQLGFEPGVAPAPVLFLNLGGLKACPWRAAPEGAIVVGYVAGRPLTAAAHFFHDCCAQVLELRGTACGPQFTALILPPGLASAPLTVREADVLALLLSGASDRVAAAALGVAPATVRTHARAVLRKAGVADRRDLRRLDVRSPAIAAPLAELCITSFDRSPVDALPARPASATSPVVAPSSGLRALPAEVRAGSPRGRSPVAQG
jgi:DNA-binding CsgD family transcriptional regulator